MIILDTNVVSELMRPAPERMVLRWFSSQAAEDLHVTDPNNPTGSFLKRDELRFLQSLGLPLISDEVFADYAFKEDAQRVGTLSATTETLAFSMSGLSKIAGLPQMKLGWIVISGPPAARAEARDKLEWIADTYLSVSAPVQQAAPRLLELGKSIH